jgi:uncharacterized protein
MPELMSPSLLQLTRYAVARSLFTPTTLPGAIAKLGFVQADPIRAPARAQDLSLRHRVKNYLAGDLERRYPKLQIEEDFFVNYGFLTPQLQALMHPRTPHKAWSPQQASRAEAIAAFVGERGIVHPKEVEAHFAHGTTRNWFGGSSNISTQLLDAMHFRGLLRVARREGGTRLYELRKPTSSTVPDNPAEAFDALTDAIVALYAPMPASSLLQLLGLLTRGVPQWKHFKTAAYQRARQRLPSAVVSGITWYWPVGENPASTRWQRDAGVRLLAPFDPVVWDRRRFDIFWGWTYRFEAYTPPAKRLRGYYALPLLWRDQVIGWGNVARQEDRMVVELGYVRGKAPREAGYKAELDQELQSMAQFLGLTW